MRKSLVRIALAIVFSFFVQSLAAFPAKSQPRPDEIRAIYLNSNHLFNKKKIAELEKILATTNANAIVIDFKDSNSLPQEYMTNLAGRFKKRGVYTIARIVTFQDTYFATKHPEIAIKTSSGEF